MLTQLRFTLDKLHEFKKEDLGDEEVMLLHEGEHWLESEAEEDIEDTAGAEEDEQALPEVEAEMGSPIELPLRSVGQPEIRVDTADDLGTLSE
jgi:hypothetical protein